MSEPNGANGSNEAKVSRDFWSKLDIFGRLVSSIILVVIAMLVSDAADKVKQGSQQVANALKRGQLVQSLVSDLATKQDRVRQDLALIALDRTASAKEDNDLIDDIAEEILLSEPPSGSDYSGKTAMIILERRDKARAAKLREKILANLSSPTMTALSSAQVSPTHDMPIKPITFEQRVTAAVLQKLASIEFRGPENMDLMNRLRQQLAQSGLPGPEVEEVKIDFPNQVRYFNLEDRALAVETANVVQNFIRTQTVGKYPDYEIAVRSFVSHEPKPPAGQVEVWCNLGRKAGHGAW
jgi:hypothetical protein